MKKFRKTAALLLTRVLSLVPGVTVPRQLCLRKRLRLQKDFWKADLQWRMWLSSRALLLSR